MGCDIHLYIEYKGKKRADSNWREFGGRINPGRNYFMFAIMAGVRGDAPFSYPAKGLPEDLAYASRNDSRMFISDTENDDHVTLEKAKQWETYGHKIINDTQGNPAWVEHPDWHSNSWLTVEEFEKALSFYNEKELKWREAEYEAVLAAMKKLSEFDNEVRIVFWFDN